ncbi:CehA/McbA family metallohydrolase domain-containing protein [Desulfocurvus sp. DL9XJH121]
MAVNWTNPYECTNGHWLKGNLHAHTAPASPCSVIPQDELLALYRDAGHDFLSISDHLHVTRAEDERLVLIPGLEWNSRIGHMPDHSVTHQHHLGLYTPDHETLKSCLAHRTQGSLLAAVQGRDVLLVANHPGWEKGHYDLADLLRLSRAVPCVEIYNAVIEGHEGQADVTHLWDRLLSADSPMLGLASDDSHAGDGVGRAWIMVRAEERTPASILAAVAEGNFYCSTGAAITDLGRDGDAVRITLPAPARITVIGRMGARLAVARAQSLSWSFSQADTPYARFHVMDSDWGQAWSQPFFRADR